MEPLRIGFVTSELAPFAKTGGLADVSAALPRYLHRAGHDVRVFLPFYSRIDARLAAFERDERLSGVPVQLAGRQVRYDVIRAELPGTDLKLHFIHCPELYGRPGIYTSDPDEHLRFLLLTRAALDLSQLMGFSPHVYHLQDWQAALLPLYLRTLYAWDRDRFGATKTVLTIHNLGYQGRFPAERLADTGLIESRHLFHQDHLREGWWSFLETGILYADAITTVSPTYAREIQTPQQGMGLDGLLRQRAGALTGILNGVDYGEWSPENDPLLVERYDAASLDRKVANKQALLEAMGLPYGPRVPVLGIVSRMTVQKGLDLVLDVMPDLLAARDLRLVVLGSGEPQLEEGFARLQRAFPRQVSFHNGFNNKLAHWIEAGADLFLMPSRYEPCGLNQMYSLRYATVPIVYRTGGLADTVEPWDASTGEGTGFVFEHHDGQGLAWAIRAALEAWEDPKGWRRLQRNGMSRNFSWEVQARRYVELYRAVSGLG